MSFYLGPDLARLRQAELLEEAANDRLVRLTREGQADTGTHRVPVGRLAAAVTAIALLAIAIVLGLDGADVTAGLGGPRG